MINNDKALGIQVVWKKHENIKVICNKSVAVNIKGEINKKIIQLANEIRNDLKNHGENIKSLRFILEKDRNIRRIEKISSQNVEYDWHSHGKDIEKQTEKLIKTLRKINFSTLKNVADITHKISHHKELNVKSRKTEALSILHEGFQKLPDNIKDVPKGFSEIPIKTIQEVKAHESVEVKPISNIVTGNRLIEEVLKELDRLKDSLGGSPIFGDSSPTINTEDENKTFLGIPMVAVKDWFKKVLHERWTPQFFWKRVAKLFDVNVNIQESQYEKAHIRIQQFGRLIDNKERFLEILEKQDANRYLEFGLITGLAWHPKDNGIGVEKIYIEFVEKFLTEYFEAAKHQGDATLIEFFNSFSGVCFEDRCRILEQYAELHPLGTAEEIATLVELNKDVKKIIDIQINPNEPSMTAFYEVLRGLGLASLEAGNLLTGGDFIKGLREYQIFDREFPTSEGTKARPSLADAHAFTLKEIDNYTIEPYSLNDFLQTELEIFLSTDQNSEVQFLKQIEKRNGVNEGFKKDSPEVIKIIQGYVDVGKLTKDSTGIL